MSQFRVVAPCVYVKDGAAVHHREPGALVSLTAEQAAGCGDAVEAVDRAPRPTQHVERKKKSEDG